MKIALVGNQNSGKTTLFNCLTGMNAKIGNWPGATIEKKTAILKGTNYELTDLPGIYSLSPYSVEEEIARKFIFEEKPKVIINIIDATSLERSLYLTTQLLELDCKVIIALNMADMLEKKGIKIDINKLEQKLRTKIIQISALKQIGIDELIREINKLIKLTPVEIFDKNVELGIKNIETEVAKNIPHKRFVAIKILESDERFDKYITSTGIEISKIIGKNYDTDLEEIIATERYSFIENIKKECTERKLIKETLTDKIDEVLLNRWIAFPIFVFIMFFMYYLSVGIVGGYTVEVIEGLFEGIGEKLCIIMENIGVSKWLNSLIVDGIIAGVGAVLGFVPQLIILFLCISILETTGYMSRIAMLLDKLFRKIGLSGKSLIPFIIGSGCSVPGIMGSRIIENQDERKMTSILVPFVPCSAKLPIIVLFTGYFFEENAGFVSVSLYFFAIVVIILSAIIMKKFIFKHTSSTYISELPEYKLPDIKYIVKDVFYKIREFIKRAGTVILICSIVIWFLLAFSFELEYGVDVEDSILATVGNKISWIFYPILGENSWGATVSAIQGFVAKEQVISSLVVIGGLAADMETEGDMFASGGIFSFFTTASAYAFMVFNLFSAPCFSAISAMRRELGGTKEMLKAIVFQTILAWLLATSVYQIGSSNMNLENIVVIAILLIIVILIINSMSSKKKNECVECPYCSFCSKK